MRSIPSRFRSESPPFRVASVPSRFERSIPSHFEANAFVGQLGWQGQNLVAASAYNLKTERGPREEYTGFAPSPGRVTLEKEGVNVGSSWF